MRERSARADVIVPSLNTRVFLRSCLLSLTAQRGDPIRSVIVVDMGSTDGTLELLADEFPDVVVLKDTPNKGYGAAVNAGAAVARADWLLVINSDVEWPSPASVAGLLEAARGSERSLFGVRLANSDGSHQRSAGSLPGRFALAWMYWTPLRYAAALNAHALGYLDDETMTRPTPVGWVKGAVVLVARSFFMELGGFDEAFFMNSEEVDLCARVYEAGGDVVYLPGVTAVHHGGGSTGDREAGLRWLAEGHARYTRKHFGRATLLAALALAAVGYVASMPVWAGRALRRGAVSEQWSEMLMYGRVLGSVFGE